MAESDLMDKKPVSLAELKEELSKIQKRDEELGFRSGKTQEYVNSLDVLSVKDNDSLKKQLEELEIPRLKEEHIVKILDFLPRSEAELEVLLQGYPITISKENFKKIVDVVNSFERSQTKK